MKGLGISTRFKGSLVWSSAAFTLCISACSGFNFNNPADEFKQAILTGEIISKDGEFQGEEDQPIPGFFNAVSKNPESLTYQIVNQPALGTVAIGEKGQFVFNPRANLHGDDFFTFVATDGDRQSKESVIKIKISPINDAPVVTDGLLRTIEDPTPQEFPTQQYRASASTLDVEGDPITYSLTDSPKSPIKTLKTKKGTVTLDSVLGLFTFVPDPEVSGEDEFSYWATDSNGATGGPGKIHVSIRSKNDPPSIRTIPTPHMREGDPLTVFKLPVDDPDCTALDAPDCALLTFRITSITQSATALDMLVPDMNTVFQNQGTFQFKPKTDFNGTVTLNYAVDDGVANLTGAFNVIVDPVNDAPTFSTSVISGIYTRTVGEGNTITVDLKTLVNDVDTGDSLNLQQLNNSMLGVFSIANDTKIVTYRATTNVPDNQTRTEDVVLKITDNQGATTPSNLTLRFTITAQPNRTPQITAANDTITLQVREKDKNIAIPLQENANDPDPEDTGNLDFKLTVPNNFIGALTPAPSITAKTYTYSAPDQCQPAAGTSICNTSFTYFAFDSRNASSETGTVRIQISAVDDPPVPVSPTQTIQESKTISLALTASDPDTAANTLRYQLVPQTAGSAYELVSIPLAPGDPANALRFRTKSGGIVIQTAPNAAGLTFIAPSNIVFGNQRYLTIPFKFNVLDATSSREGIVTIQVTRAPIGLDFITSFDSPGTDFVTDVLGEDSGDIFVLGTQGAPDSLNRFERTDGTNCPHFSDNLTDFDSNGGGGSRGVIYQINRMGGADQGCPIRVTQFGGVKDDHPKAMVKYNNWIYAVGTTFGGIKIDNGTLTGEANPGDTTDGDAFLIKYQVGSTRIRWARVMGQQAAQGLTFDSPFGTANVRFGSKTDEALGVTVRLAPVVTTAGITELRPLIYVTGYTQVLNNGVYVKKPFIMKYVDMDDGSSSQGIPPTQLWNKYIVPSVLDLNSSEVANGIVVAPDGNGLVDDIYLVGTSGEGVVKEGFVAHFNISSPFTNRMGEADSRMNWADRIDSSTTSEVNAITFISEPNNARIYVTGATSSPQTGLLSPFIARYQHSAVENRRWIQFLEPSQGSGTGLKLQTKVQLDANLKSLTTLYLLGTANGDFTQAYNPPGGMTDALIAKITEDSTGSSVQTQRTELLGGSGNELARGFFYSEIEDRYYVGGYSGDNYFGRGVSANQAGFSGPSQDGFLIKFELRNP